MSTERLSFGFNSLIPETYKSKAEAFARCLQHKLLSLGRVDSSSGPFGGGSRMRPSEESERQRDAEKTLAGQQRSRSEGSRPEGSSPGQRTDAAEDSEEEFCSHSESEGSDFSEHRRQAGQKPVAASSEDSTVDSWSSCQENLTDVERPDSEGEEADGFGFASQIRGSPKLRSYNIRSKRKELREKSWKRNSRRNHSSSTESVDSEGLKQTAARQGEALDPEASSQYILFDGLEPEGEEVPHRILRESSSTSNLERHFSCREDSRAEPTPAPDPDLLTPPPSPNLHRKAKHRNHATDWSLQLRYANVETDPEEVEFDEVEILKDFALEGIARHGTRVGSVVVECPGAPCGAASELPPERGAFVVTRVDVLRHSPTDAPEEAARGGLGEEPGAASRGSGTPELTEDEILNSRSKMRRCSSLKTWKTPPGTPGAKKIVRFADALGLDLADVRTFLDEIPRVPSSAYEDLHFELTRVERLPPQAAAPTLIPLFQQPSNATDFLERVRSQKICLESAVVADAGFLTVTGCVRVHNLSFHKAVHVRYSLNNWGSFADLQATYVPDSCDGFSDKFSFVLFGHTLRIGERLEFALRLDCSGAQYWDNNGGVNYVFDCLPRTSAGGFFSGPPGGEADPWPEFY